MWNGCWCTWFHPACADKGAGAEGGRAYKERLVREGMAHAALVLDGDVAVAWCEYGSPEELPNIYHRKEYKRRPRQGARLPPHVLLVDTDNRRKGVAATALRGALGLIAKASGGVVEAYPQDTQGKRTAGSFLYNGTRSLFEKAGFRTRDPRERTIA